MKSKDRVVIKDYFLSVLCSGAIAALIVMVFIPILLYTIGRQIGEGIPVFSVFFSGTLESIAVVEVITHIVLGALVLQYMQCHLLLVNLMGSSVYASIYVHGSYKRQSFP